MEELSPNLYTDYAHTPEKIMGCLSIAGEIAQLRNKNIAVVYEPLTNRRQYFVKKDYKHAFDGIKKLYWVPTYLSREDPRQRILSPDELIACLSRPEIAQAAPINDNLWSLINDEINNNSIVICMSGGGGGSLDEWLRAKVQGLNR